MEKLPYILFQHRDDKVKQWGTVLKAHYGVRAEPMLETPIKLPVELIRWFRNDGKPKAFFFRYLSDNPSFLKTFIRFVAEWIALRLLQLKRVPIFWICHNVDRETKHFHSLTDVRRRMVARSAERIFVMDEQLVDYAKSVFPEQAAKIDYLSF